VEELQPERSHSHNPLVQALFVQQNTPRSETSMEGLELSGVPLSSPSKFDMAVFVRETDEGLIGSWQYNADLFNAATIEQMASLYLVVLKQVAQDADSRIGAIVDLLADTQLQEAASVFEESREASRSKLKRTRRAAVSL
jgi:non-ribosomal peptide synthetase component F